MKSSISQTILTVSAVALSGSTLMAVAVPQTTYAALGDTCKSATFLTFPPWYKGLNVGTTDSRADCEILDPGTVGLSKFIWRIALNVIEMMLQAVAYIVAIMMLTAGFKLLFTEGNSDRLVNARNTITMAGVGFVISIAGVAAINLISTIFFNNPPAP